jgi:hypothetical protein
MELQKLLDYSPNDKLVTWAEMYGLISPIHFDWKPWLPVGFLTILASASGEGKSALALRIGGTFIKNLPWPDKIPYKRDPGLVLWCEAESAQALNLSRAKDWGYPMDRLITPFNEPFIDLCLEDSDHQKIILEKAAHPDIRLIVVDSLSGSNRKRESTDEIKSIAMWLAQMARDTNKPVLVTHHLRKQGMGDGDTITLDRVRGSSTIVQFARVIWALDAPDPRTPEVKRLSVIKNNLARFPQPIGMVIDDAGVTFTDAPSKPRDETQLDRACDLLQALLADGPQKTTMIQSECTNAGISWRTVCDAKKKLSIRADKESDGWYWGLP